MKPRRLYAAWFLVAVGLALLIGLASTGVLFFKRPYYEMRLSWKSHDNGTERTHSYYWRDSIDAFYGITEGGTNIHFQPIPVAKAEARNFIEALQLVVPDAARLYAQLQVTPESTGFYRVHTGRNWCEEWTGFEKREELTPTEFSAAVGWVVRE
ncbi:MAG: hypothetical protein AAF581_10565 [Planctomycetota bacterium]